MKEGVILGGGEGNRLKNRIYNKHLALCYDKLVIEYPLRTMGELGCTDVTVVVSPESGPDIMVVASNGDDYGLNIQYAIQEEPLGAADALSKAEGIKGVFPVLCGDVYFDPAPEPSDVPTLYWAHLSTANQHSVYNPETNTIVEKPVKDIGRRAVIGYYYDERVFDVIKTLEPTERGELELIDLHNWYLQNGAEVKEYEGFFGDMGTPDGLLRVANHIAHKGMFR